MLVSEHDQILKCLDLLASLCERMGAGASYPKEAPELAVRFLRAFADRLHHQKEEDTLFPALEAAGMPRNGGPIAVMLEEHEEGRGLVRDMAACLDGLAQEDSRAAFARAGRGFIGLLRDHIEKENEVLFAMADDILPPAKAAEIARVYATHRELEASAYAAADADLEALEAALG